MLLLGTFNPPASAQPAADPSQNGISAKIARYARRLVDKYDRNGNGRLEQDEWQRMRGDPSRADADGDAVISFEELARHVASYSLRRKIRLRSPGPELLFAFPLPQAANDTVSLSQQDAVPAGRPTPSLRQVPRYHVSRNRLPDGLPEWFTQRDADGDGQVSLSEFTQQTPSDDVGLFARCDADNDGVVTAQECVRVMKTLAQEKKKEEPVGSALPKEPQDDNAVQEKPGGSTAEK